MKLNSPKWEAILSALSFLALTQNVKGDASNEIDFGNIIQGKYCLESTLPQYQNMTWFELIWTVKNYKKYFEFCQRLGKPFLIVSSSQMNLNGTAYNADILLKHNPTGFGAFCNFDSFSSSCSTWNSQTTLVEIQLRPVYDRYSSSSSPPLELMSDGFLYEGDLWYKSKENRVRVGPLDAKMTSSKDFLNGIKFEFDQTVNKTMLESIIGTNSKYDDVELTLVIKQYKKPPTSNAYDLLENCKKF